MKCRCGSDEVIVEEREDHPIKFMVCANEECNQRVAFKNLEGLEDRWNKRMERYNQ